MEKVVVRFAPSPTGYLHIGGARTALFNYLFAKHHNGLFRLRIEDTDRTRSKPEFTEQILASMAWLGLKPDGEVVFQSKRSAQYNNAIEKLLKNDHAYRCFCTREDIDARRAGDPGWKYDQKCISLTKDEIHQNFDDGRPFVVRLKIPSEQILFHDLIRGDVIFKGDEFEDFIIVRSDGSPIYQLTVVVDDHDMGITHVIRGDDHLSNTPKQIFLYRALGMEPPEFGHIPLIFGPDKKRLSKRHGATSVEEYRDQGFLPEALVNFIALLGWNPGDDREIMNPGEMIGEFSTERISKSAAVFDYTKALWLNGQYISKLSDKKLEDMFIKLYKRKGIAVEKTDRLIKILGLLRPRVRTISELYDGGVFFFQPPEQYNEKGIRKHFSGEQAVKILHANACLIEECDPFDEVELETRLRAKAEREGSKAAHYIHPLRLALTGSTSSPGIFETVMLIGRDECVLR
ncbi:MAG: glutamate--tRNA ligase, partial [Holophagae bacterium]|nr:glutamate--tRNA ligase [Holophagae bacterium]